MIHTQNGKTFGSQNPQMLVHWTEVDADNKLIDAGVIRCTDAQEAEFLSAASDEGTKQARVESWVLANRQ